MGEAEICAPVDAFAGQNWTLEGARLAPAPDAARLILRGGAQAAARAGEAFGLDAPTRPRRAARDAHGRRAFWLGPDEWMLSQDGANSQELIARLSDALGGREGPDHALFDVTNRQVCFDLSGPKSTTILAGGCPLDLHESSFAIGEVARTLYAKAEITLVRDGAEDFRVETSRSFLPYLLAHMRHAALGAPD
jgi:sarcosine oxidase subunit gamma